MKIEVTDIVWVGAVKLPTTVTLEIDDEAFEELVTEGLTDQFNNTVKTYAWEILNTRLRPDGNISDQSWELVGEIPLPAVRRMLGNRTIPVNSYYYIDRIEKPGVGSLALHRTKPFQYVLVQRSENANQSD